MALSGPKRQARLNPSCSSDKYHDRADHIPAKCCVFELEATLKERGLHGRR